MALVDLVTALGALTYVGDTVTARGIVTGGKAWSGTTTGQVLGAAGKVRGFVVNFDQTCAAGDSVKILDATSLKMIVVAGVASESILTMLSTPITCATSIQVTITATGTCRVFVFYEVTA